METVEVGGLRIAYRRAGTGPVLVLVHGALGDSRDWRRQLEGLGDELTVVAWDAPGCGGSNDPPETFRLADFADCLAGFVAALGIERPHVLGLSFGGGLALELYRRHPGLPRSLVLASAYAGWKGSLPSEVVRERVERAEREAGLPPEQWARGYLPGLFTEAAPPELLEEAAAIMLDVRPAGMRAMIRSFADADLRDVLPGIRVPTLLLYGDADGRSPLGTVAAELHRKIPGSRLRILPGVGHAANLEAPERFNAEVREFLRTVP
ncbi:MAG TPA: alpha/beta hydrolase [Actinomycetota bacterium]|nr:alpha/beta hydrolase [Actinomycetota bacterium]